MRITPSDYHTLTDVTELALSPDGSQVSYVCRTPETEREYTSTIYLSATDGEETTRLTLASGNDTGVRWSPDGEQIAFVSDRGECDTPQLWLVPVDGGEATRLTNVIDGVSDPTWSPDGRYIAFSQQVSAEERDLRVDVDVATDADYTREEPDPRVIRRLVYREHEAYTDGRRHHIYIYDRKQETVARLTDNEYDHENPEWGDAQTVYYSTRRTGDPDDNLVHDIVAHDIESGETTTVTQTTGWDPSFSATTDGRVAYRYSDNDEPGPSMHLTEIRVFDPETGAEQTVTDSLSRRVYRGSTPVWDSQEEDLYFLVPDEGRVRLYTCTSGSSSGVTAVATPGTEHIEAISVGDGRVAFIQSTAETLGDVFIVDGTGGTPSQVTRLNDEYLSSQNPQVPEEVWINAADGTAVQGWVLTPPDFSPEEEYPAVLEVHGGPMIMWTTSGTMWHEFQLLADAGYVVAWCNPRGSTGYGESHTTAIAEEWGGPDYRDLMAFTDEIVSRPGVDADNLFVTGGSFGGFMTSWLVGHTDRFSAAVTQRGVYDQIAQFGATDTYHANEKQLGLPWENPMKYWDASPIAYADEVDTPTLIVHSEHDYRVPIHNADTLFRFYRKNGVETRYIRYPREGHELSRSGEPAHVADRLQRILRWFNGYSDYHESPPVVQTDETPADWTP